MNREIKFRAWDKTKKEMIKVNQWIFDSPPKDLELMQFTGLLDKLGKEIYEGDIIKQDNFPSNLFVKWDYDGYYLFENICNEASIDEKEIEVLGNIYENPELIK